MKKFCIVFVIFLFFLATPAQAVLTEQQMLEQEAKWQAELKTTEEDIAKWESILNQTKQSTASLERDASVLQA